MSNTQPDPCPAWCERTHHVGAGHVHRCEVGRLTVLGEVITVIVAQTPTCDARVALTSFGYVAINEDDLDDARALFTLLGFPYLAQLIEQAQAIAQHANDQRWRARTAEETPGS
jgi:hypothetical protein